MTYDSATLDDIATRLTKGWKIRVDEMETLLRMARELVDMKQGANAKPQSPTIPLGYPWVAPTTTGGSP